MRDKKRTTISIGIGVGISIGTNSQQLCVVKGRERYFDFRLCSLDDWPWQQLVQKHLLPKRN